MVAFNSRSGRSSLVVNPAAHDARPVPGQTVAERDAVLVRRFLAGDNNAFTEIVARHQARTFLTAFEQLRNHADAEEITQDTFIRARRALGQFQGETSLAAWLHRITVSLAFNRYCYFSRRRRHLSQSPDLPCGERGSQTLADDLVAADAPGLTRATMARELIQAVADCTERLLPAHREILRLRNVLNRSYDEIATTLGVSVDTVKTRIGRARGNLQNLVARIWPGFTAEGSGLPVNG
jgi:RNA polymerase sigma-70 factor, ECF subfamily